ncbi:division/cell wall cluster transcriptional repressor MraZ [Prosthecochloris sp. N3]|uniref:Transcriptional regulator MraZ n=1 Tax=Prosthecochloris ethylica TaxID=2743976 RepID=A0ABR9XRD4_9CHLB|nr:MULTISPECIES: division/cell wall cluster transcriptional repressor MraZ [Prosthecochloris]MEC9486369.1 division/cell wall cluster transcriptional repressor MraZ [Prosthecochloris sp.]MBF0586092.1 division/cell wall cluster transcriptional repressor MraZ [Prosthecochloris ethylica]MBF0636508.1 division/cell wall cluster transcriptional repressor MraZ [Prosthecochloris ethylica]NUK47140.1 division/cell wall cluster transcriptional repressor MraZ [Prosthecochloris ethylica]RNA65684.1 transcrip
MAGFIGKEQHSIDEKGRLMIPARFRRRMGEDSSGNPSFLYAMKVPDGSIELYEPHIWAEKERAIMKLSDFNPDERLLKTLLYESLDGVDVDRQGRIALSREFLQHAGIGKDVVIVGASLKLVLWSPDVLRKVVHDNASRFQVLAGRYF